jgi:hypothetical protein
METTHTFTEGDIIYSVGKDGMYFLSKILKIDKFDDGEVWHQLMYNPVKELPEISKIKDLTVFAYHVPMAKPNELPGYLANFPLTEDDLEGYNVYVNQTQS